MFADDCYDKGRGNPTQGRLCDVVDEEDTRVRERKLQNECETQRIHAAGAIAMGKAAKMTKQKYRDLGR